MFRLLFGSVSALWRSSLLQDAVGAARREGGFEGHCRLDAPLTARRLRLACLDGTVLGGSEQDQHSRLYKAIGSVRALAQLESFSNGLLHLEHVVEPGGVQHDLLESSVQALNQRQGLPEAFTNFVALPQIKKYIAAAKQSLIQREIDTGISKEADELNAAAAKVVAEIMDPKIVDRDVEGTLVAIQFRAKVLTRQCTRLKACEKKASLALMESKAATFQSIHQKIDQGVRLIIDLKRSCYLSLLKGKPGDNGANPISRIASACEAKEVPVGSIKKATDTCSSKLMQAALELPSTLQLNMAMSEEQTTAVDAEFELAKRLVDLVTGVFGEVLMLDAVSPRLDVFCGPAVELFGLLASDMCFFLEGGTTEISKSLYTDACFQRIIASFDASTDRFFSKLASEAPWFTKAVMKNDAKPFQWPKSFSDRPDKVDGFDAALSIALKVEA